LELQTVLQISRYSRFTFAMNQSVGRPGTLSTASPLRRGGFGLFVPIVAACGGWYIVKENKGWKMVAGLEQI
jgi:hypothetical protein